MNALPDCSTWRVLIVDDDFDYLSLVRELFELCGATVFTCHDSARALELSVDEKPNLVMLDLSMPDLGGWELRRQLRQVPEISSVPIVAHTALAQRSDQERTMRDGFDAYVTKPCWMRVLMEKLERVMKKSANKLAKKNGPGSRLHAGGPALVRNFPMI